MNAFYSALAIIENQKPRTRREAIRQEEKFYADMAHASRFWRFFTALAGKIRAAATGRSEKESRKSSERTNCDHGQAESHLRVLICSTGKGDSTGATDGMTVCGSVHTRFS